MTFCPNSSHAEGPSTPRLAHTNLRSRTAPLQPQWRHQLAALHSAVFDLRMYCCSSSSRQSSTWLASRYHLHHHQLLALLVVVLLPGCCVPRPAAAAQPGGPAPPTPVLFSHDGGVDDFITLLLLLANPQQRIKLLGISILDGDCYSDIAANTTLKVSDPDRPRRNPGGHQQPASRAPIPSSLPQPRPHSRCPAGPQPAVSPHQQAQPVAWRGAVCTAAASVGNKGHRCGDRCMRAAVCDSAARIAS